MNIKARKKLLQKLNLPFCTRQVWVFLGTIKHFTSADLEQLEYGICLIRDQEQVEQQADQLAFWLNQI